ncbi:hypothetical protein PRUPE_8G014300 [Prunus persica]|uniref:Uncharacterized protein n=1 Tax=Prunus persica TaxID=3760 RepID=A0A251MR55_PRUPE|nr:hypothetical protein PRUPE_8G014300 [Prunus persica]
MIDGIRVFYAYKKELPLPSKIIIQSLTKLCQATGNLLKPPNLLLLLLFSSLLEIEIFLIFLCLIANLLCYVRNSCLSLSQIAKPVKA